VGGVHSSAVLCSSGLLLSSLLLQP
jgi:hypothetical protein